MHAMHTTVAPSLKALLTGFIDYAGCFPPASVSPEQAVSNFEEYKASSESWMLHWLVIAADALDKVPAHLDRSISLLSETQQSRAAALETKSAFKVPMPAYCEVALDRLDYLDEVKANGCFAKIRMGGVKPEAIPAPPAVTAFIIACADRKLAFKATAGLHHSIRALQKLTYEADSPRAVMHGFINVLMAAAFAWHGEREIEPIISETEANNFRFDDRAYWRDKSLSIEQIEEARKNFIHSVGSCSFEEPVHDLKQLGLL